MSDQKRTFDVGDPVIAPDDNETREYLQDPGVYSGLGLGVDASGDVTIAAGVGLMPDGTMWQESDTNTLSFTLPGAPTNYTVVASHDDRLISGGTAVTYALQSGTVTSVTDGVILGWIYYTGSGTDPLLLSHMLDAPVALPSTSAQAYVDSAPLELWAPLPRTYSDTAAMGGNVVFTGQMADDVLFDTTYFVIYQKVEKTAGPAVDETLVQHINFNMGSYRPDGFDFFVNIPGGGRLVLELRDTDLNIVTLSAASVTTTTNWEWVSVEVDRLSGNFAANSPYELRLTSTVNLNQEVKLAAVRARYWPYPV